MLTTFYAKGGATGSGFSADDPFGFELEEKWDLIEDTAKSEPVIVRLVAGLHLHPKGKKYEEWFTIKLRDFVNRVTIMSDEPGAASLYCLEINQSSNLEINGLTWTNPPKISPKDKYVFRTSLPIGNFSHDIEVVNCIFRNLPNIFRSGSHAEGYSHHIRYLGCTFENIGDNGGSHLMYHIDNAHHIILSKCIFRDCMGDYVRFRNNVHHCIVDDCLFENTGRYPDLKNKKPFIAAYVNNSCKPGTTRDDVESDKTPTCTETEVVPDEEREEAYQMFGTDFVVINSHFKGNGMPFQFSHVGWDFPGHDYLLKENEKTTLEVVSLSPKQALLKDKYGILVERVMMVNIERTGGEPHELCRFWTSPADEARDNLGAVGAVISLTNLINKGVYNSSVTALTLDEIGCYVELESTGRIQWIIKKNIHPNYDAIVRMLHDSALQKHEVVLRLRRDIGRTNEILYINQKYIT